MLFMFSRSRLFCSVLVTFGLGSLIDRSDPVSDIAVEECIVVTVFKRPFILQRAGDIRSGVLFNRSDPVSDIVVGD